jgi:chemotaxis signal transduction protein
MSALETTTGFEAAARAAAPRIAFRPHRQWPWMLLPEGMPLQILMEASAVRVPNTRSWFLGVVSQRGNLLPVFDLANWAELPVTADANPKVVAIGLGTQACGMLCVDAPTLLSVGTEDFTLAEDGALSPFLGRGYTSALGRAREFDIQRWLATAAQQISDNKVVRTA